MPMMLFPSISRASRATRTCAWNWVARWTNFAAARACMPSWFTTVTLRDTIKVQGFRVHGSGFRFEGSGSRFRSSSRFPEPNHLNS